MGLKPIPLNKWKKWLKMRGLEYKRTEGHEIWDYPEGSEKSILRPVTFRPSKKEVPGIHIHTNLKTLGVDYNIFLEEIKQL